MAELQLSEIWRYPVKSMRGARLDRIGVDAGGPSGDRRWMLVDTDGNFLTQRQLARMALIDVEITDRGLRLACQGQAVEVPTPDPQAPLHPVRVWSDNCLAQFAGQPVGDWLSELLGQACRLAWLPPTQQRPVTPDYARPGDQVAFSDGFPFLLISQASLDDLNARLDRPVPMYRFRPNLVIEGCEPFAEDGWKRIRVGEIEFRVAKPCSRCIIPTIDPQTAERSAEPLRTLSGYRRRENKVYFGQNLLHDGPGQLAEGMPVEILE